MRRAGAIALGLAVALTIRGHYEPRVSASSTKYLIVTVCRSSSGPECGPTQRIYNSRWEAIETLARLPENEVVGVYEVVREVSLRHVVCTTNTPASSETTSHLELEP